VPAVGVCLEAFDVNGRFVVLAVVEAAQPNRDVIRISHLGEDELIAGDF
jgi:hypothetical protein